MYPEEFIRSDDLKILHVGCGDGEVGARLKKRDASLSVWGVEADCGLADAARGRLDRVIAGRLSSMVPLPLKHGFFDCALIDDLGPLGDDPAWTLRRLRPHLAAGGRVVFSVPNAGSARDIGELLGGRVPPAMKGGLTREMLREAMFHAGYRLLGEPDCEAGGDASPALVSALQTAALLASGDPASLVPERLMALAEPMTPVVDQRTAGALGPEELAGTSVIVLTYNSRETIDACLGSVVKTLRPIDELIVVDNASQDGTADHVQALGPKLTLIRNERNLGFAAGCNVGLRASKGRHVCLLNPDTEVWAGWIQALERSVQGAAIGVAGPLSDNVTGLQFVGHWVGPVDPKPSPRDLAKICREQFSDRAIESKLIIGLCAMFRRDTLDEIGLLDEDLFLGSDDLEMCWRLQTHGLRAVVAQDVFVHHKGGHSFSSEDPDRVKALLYELTETVIAKITDAYGWRVPDELLWGFRITHT